MTKYETVIKVLSQVGHETLEMIGKCFAETYYNAHYLKYSDIREVLYDLQVYFHNENISIKNVSKDNATHIIFGNICESTELKDWSCSEIEWGIGNHKEDFNKNTLSIFNQLECCHCNDCHFCCYRSIFFIEEFYDFCLEQTFVKILIEEMNNKEVKKIKEKEERKEENMDNLRTIAEKLVDNFDEYEEIIYKLRDVGVSDEKIYNIFYEILKDISE